MSEDVPARGDPKSRFRLAKIGADVKEERKTKLLEEMKKEEESTKPRKLPKRKKPHAQIPDSGKLGQRFTVKLDKRYDTATLEVYQGEEIEEDAGNTNAVHSKTDKKTDEISYDFYDPLPLREKEINGLVPGKYLVKVHASGNEFGDELEQEKVVDITA